MLIIDNIENLIECPCGTAYIFNEKDLRLVMNGMFAVTCPKCGQISYVVPEVKFKKYNEPMEIKGEVE